MVLFSYNYFPVLHIFPTSDGIAVNARYVAVGAEGGVLGVHDAARGVVVVGVPQGQGALGVLEA